MRGEVNDTILFTANTARFELERNNIKAIISLMYITIFTILYMYVNWSTKTIFI